MTAPKTNYKAWLEKAEHDFLNIDNNLAAADIPWDTVCFHAQQAAEKILKGFLVHHGQPLSRTHDLVALLDACAGISPSLASLEQHCRKLNYFAVSSRYPDDLFQPGENEGRELLAAARRVQAQILASLPG